MQEYYIQYGDTLYSIARSFGIRVDTILKLNPQIKNPSQIYAGQLIYLPAGAKLRAFIYTVRPGDTLINISRRFRIPYPILLSSNSQGLNVYEDPANIYPGQKLIIPNPEFQEKLEVYRILQGDTLYGISSKFKTTVEKILSLNRQTITNPPLIIAGTDILVPTVLQPITTGFRGCLAVLSDRLRPGQNEAFNIWLSDIDGRRQFVLNISELGYESAPKWSPDGKMIAYNRGGTLVLADSCASSLRDLATTVIDFAWSNDGKRIAFSNEAGLFTVDLGGNTRQISSIAGNLRYINWFPGDTRIAASSSYTSGDYEIHYMITVDLPSGNITSYRDNPLVPAWELSISPDGRYAAGISTGVQDNSNMYIYDFNTKKLSKITVNTFKMGGWSPDSKRLVYIGAPEGDYNYRIELVNTEGTILDWYYGPGSFFMQVSWGNTSDVLVLSTIRYYTENLLDIYCLSISAGDYSFVMGAGTYAVFDVNNIKIPYP